MKITENGIEYIYNIEINTKFGETFQLPIISNKPIEYSPKESTKTDDKILQLILIYTKYNISLYKRSDGTYNLRFESLLSGEEFNLLIKLTKKDCELLNINPEVEYQYVREQFEDILRWLIKENK